MDYYGAKDLAAAFRTVRKNTIIIAEEIGEEHYDFRPAPESRSVAETLIHIAVVPQAAHHIHGTAHISDLAKLNFMEFFGPRMALEKKPHTKAQILAMLHEEGDKFAGFLDTVTEELLAERVAMPPGMEPSHKTRFEMLLGPKEHEMHHRAQLMVIQRLLGMKPHLTRQIEARMAAMQAAKAAS
ncbi:MAG TPA: DinB family protein [Bryobacteraceae bacterium]|jgi:uncharacterized damage-inducible protein DinB|nr:DinB family protein [Bryobacteraceae bacterium]